MAIYKLHQTISDESDDFYFEKIVDDLPDTSILVIITQTDNQVWLQNPDVIRRITIHQRLHNYYLERSGIGASEYAPQYFALIYRKKASNENSYQNNIKYKRNH